MIKAIETRYNGYRFRSRLEARWAVFFDALNIKYEYEKEGFDLGELGWYLPDFWLPEMKLRTCSQTGIWIEIKPKPPLVGEVIKIQELHYSDSINGGAALIYGDAWYFGNEKERGIIFPNYYDAYYDAKERLNYRMGWWKECTACGTIEIDTVYRSQELSIYCRRHWNMFGNTQNMLDTWQAQRRFKVDCCAELDKSLPEFEIKATYQDSEPRITLKFKKSNDTDKLESAYRAARGARFEHGESG